MKKCLFCGKVYQPRHPKQKFCCVKCRQKAGYLADMLKEDEAIKKTERKREKKKKVDKEKAGFKLWSFEDRECLETWAFIKTIKPIDFKALYSSEKEKLKAKKEYKKHYEKRG